MVRLILGGYENPIPLDETINAVYAVCKMLPPELRVTGIGGLDSAPFRQRHAAGACYVIVNHRVRQYNGHFQTPSRPVTKVRR